MNFLGQCAKCGEDIVGKVEPWLETHRLKCTMGLKMSGWFKDCNGNAFFYGFDSTPEIELEEGQTGHLKQSKLKFKITKIDGEEITIRYSFSRQDWTGKKDELVAVADFDPPARRAE